MNFKICSIGCGPHAGSVHGPSQKKYATLNADVTLAACCDIDAERARSYAKAFGFKKSYTQYEKMLDEEKPDAVCVILPPSLACKIAIALFSRRIPVLLEKPPGLNVIDLNSLIEASREYQTPHLVAFNRRFTPLIESAYHILNQDFPADEVYQVNYDMIRYHRADPDFSVTAIHGIDAARFLARSKFLNGTFHYQTICDGDKTITASTMTTECECGTIVRCNFQPYAGVVLERISIHAKNRSMTIDLPMWEGFDTPGILRYWHQDQLKVEIRGDELVPSNEMFETCGFYNETKAFLDGVRNNFKLSPTLPDSLQQVTLMDALREHKQHVVLI